MDEACGMEQDRSSAGGSWGLPWHPDYGPKKEVHHGLHCPSMLAPSMLLVGG